MKIRVVAADFGLFGVVKVTANREFAVERVEEDYKALFRKKLNQMLRQAYLPVWVPLKNASGVIYCQKGDPLYPYAIANGFNCVIGNFVLSGEVVE